MLFSRDLVRFESKFTRTGDGCWLWSGTRNSDGYGQFSLGGRKGTQPLAHRLSYTQYVGPIPAGLVIDHLCNKPACVNPGHLRAVTQFENTHAAHSPALYANKTHCGRNHLLAGKNLVPHKRAKGWRECLACKRAHRARQRDSALDFQATADGHFERIMADAC